MCGASMVIQHKRSSTIGNKPSRTGSGLGYVKYIFRGVQYNSGTGPSYTYTNLDIGTANNDRILVVALIQEESTKKTVSNANLNSTTTMTAICNSYAGGGRGVDVYWVACPTGTTANISMTYSAALSSHALSWWTVIGANTSAITYLANSGAGTTLPLDLSISATANSLLIGLVSSNAYATGYTWQSPDTFTERYDQDDPNSSFRITGADDVISTTGTKTINVTCSNTSSTAYYGAALIHIPPKPYQGADWGEGQLAINLADGYVYTANSNTTVNTFPVGTHGNVQTFSSSGTWNKPTSGTVALVQCWGGGGSGAFSYNVANGAAGGGGGAYSWGIFPLSALGSTETVTIGLGGAARTSNSAGENGGTTSFGSWISAYGGCGGGNSSLSSTQYGGHGGGFATPNTPGSFGTPATRNYFATGLTACGANSTANGIGGVSGFGGGGGVANGTVTRGAGDAAGGGSGGGGAGRPLANPVNPGGVAYVHEFGLGANGGAGGNNTTSGSNGSYPGGGGGGGSNTSSGAGANGQVRVIVW